MNFDIISANYNNEKFLSNFLISINQSTFLPNKLIIVDDASTDSSLLVIKKLKVELKYKVCIIVNEKNLGFAKSLNKAIKEITSEYFARLDPDDYVKPKRFEAQLNFLKNNNKIDLVGSNTDYIRLKRKISNSNNPISHLKIKKLIMKGLIPVIHGSIMGRSQTIKKFTYNQDLVPAEDYALFAYYISKKMKIANLRDSLTCVNIHSSSVSNDLKFSTIVKRYKICFNYFGYKKSFLGMRLEYFHQMYYRKYLFTNHFLRFTYLGLSLICDPLKILKRISIKAYDKF